MQRQIVREPEIHTNTLEALAYILIQNHSCFFFLYQPILIPICIFVVQMEVQNRYNLKKSFLKVAVFLNTVITFY